MGVNTYLRFKYAKYLHSIEDRTSIKTRGHLNINKSLIRGGISLDIYIRHSAD